MWIVLLPSAIGCLVDSVHSYQVALLGIIDEVGGTRCNIEQSSNPRGFPTKPNSQGQVLRTHRLSLHLGN